MLDIVNDRVVWSNLHKNAQIFYKKQKLFLKFEKNTSTYKKIFCKLGMALSTWFFFSFYKTKLVTLCWTGIC